MAVLIDLLALQWRKGAAHRLGNRPAHCLGHIQQAHVSEGGGLGFQVQNGGEGRPGEQGAGHPLREKRA